MESEPDETRLFNLLVTMAVQDPAFREKLEEVYGLHRSLYASVIERGMNEGVFVRSVYFRDPDGILLEMACWTKRFDESDAQDPPAAADGTRVAV